MSKVSREAAEQEVNNWLDFKKVNAKKRETFKENIDILVDAISDGNLVIDDKDFVFTHTLKFPLGEGDSVRELKYKPRVKVSTIHVCLQNVKAGDADGRICGHIAALTGIDRNIIKQQDTEDYEIGRSIAVFFL